MEISRRRTDPDFGCVCLSHVCYPGPIPGNQSQDSDLFTWKTYVPSVYHFFVQLWQVLGVKLMDIIKINLFSR